LFTIRTGQTFSNVLNLTQPHSTFVTVLYLCICYLCINACSITIPALENYIIINCIEPN